MASRCFLKTRIDADTKMSVQRLAASAFLTEASWLKRLVHGALRASSDERHLSPRHRLSEPCSRNSKPIAVRLAPDDRLLLAARAEARSLRPATYIAVLVRAHLRRLAPLPKEELLALKRSIAELAALGRNINQIARTANAGGRLPDTVREELRAMLKVSEALRDHTKALLKANLSSWQTGHD